MDQKQIILSGFQNLGMNKRDLSQAEKCFDDPKMQTILFQGFLETIGRGTTIPTIESVIEVLGNLTNGVFLKT